MCGSIAKKQDKGLNLDFGGDGDDRTIDPGVSVDLTFQIYMIYYRCSNNIFWVLSLKPLCSILCGDSTATMSQNSTAVFL